MINPPKSVQSLQAQVDVFKEAIDLSNSATAEQQRRFAKWAVDASPSEWAMAFLYMRDDMREHATGEAVDPSPITPETERFALLTRGLFIGAGLQLASTARLNTESLGYTAIAMLMIIAETLANKGKAVLDTSPDGFGVQVLEFIRPLVDAAQDMPDPQEKGAKND